MGFLGGSGGKESAAMQETWVPPLGREDPLEEGTATHFNPHGRGAWQTTAHNVAKSRTQVKQLSMYACTHSGILAWRIP